MALVYQETRAEAVCSLEQDVLVLLSDKSRMKGDLHVRFREKFEVKVLLLTRLRGEIKSPLLDLSIFVGKRDKPSSGIGCRSPPFPI